MNVTLHPRVVVSETNSLALQVTLGKTHHLSQAMAARLRQLSGRHEPVTALDIKLMEMGLVIPVMHETGLREKARESIRSYLSNGGALCIMPTEKCNFRCTYCYEKFEVGRMKDSLVSGVVSFLTRSAPQFSSYNLAWFGGEPLLHIDIIATVGRTFRSLQRRHGFHGNIGITTNGSLLTQSNLEILNSIAVNAYHISLDGPEGVHDAQRLSLTGKGTYKTIINNIVRLLECSASSLILRVNLNTRNAENADRTADWLKNEIVPRLTPFEDRITYKIVSIWDATTKSVDGICIADLQRFQTWLSVRQQLAATEGHEIADQIASEIAGLGTAACYAGKPNHFVLGADGTVYKCTVAFDLPENRIGKLDSDGNMNIDADLESLWTGKSVLNDPVCGNCAFGDTCLGLHCPLIRIQTQRPPCPTEKKYISEILATSPAMNMGAYEGI